MPIHAICTCMHACMVTQTFLPIHALYTCMHAYTPLYFLGNTHMQCHAHNIFFSVNMCNIYFLILIYLTVQFKCIQIQSFWCYLMFFIKCNISCNLAIWPQMWNKVWIELNWIDRLKQEWWIFEFACIFVSCFCNGGGGGRTKDPLGMCRQHGKQSQALDIWMTL